MCFQSVAKSLDSFLPPKTLQVLVGEVEVNPGGEGLPFEDMSTGVDVPKEQPAFQVMQLLEP